MEQEVPTFALDILQDVIDEGEREFELTQQRNSFFSLKEKESSSENESEVGEEESHDLFPPLGDFVDWNEELEDKPLPDGKQEEDPPVEEEPKELIRKKRKVFLDD